MKISRASPYLDQKNCHNNLADGPCEVEKTTWTSLAAGWEAFTQLVIFGASQEREIDGDCRSNVALINHCVRPDHSLNWG